MKTSSSSKSCSVYYFSLIFCTHVLHICAYTTSVCENHFSLFCCADINKIRKTWFREVYRVFLNVYWFQKKYLKKIALFVAGIFKENTFRVSWLLEWALSTESSPLHTASGWIEPNIFFIGGQLPNHWATRPQGEYSKISEKSKPSLSNE